jgi:hypothetical protein
MTEVQLELIKYTLSAIPGTVAAIVSYINNRGIRATKAQTTEVKGDVVALGKQLDGRMTEQIALTKELSFAAGKVQEKKEVRARKRARA